MSPFGWFLPEHVVSGRTSTHLVSACWPHCSLQSMSFDRRCIQMSILTLFFQRFIYLTDILSTSSLPTKPATAKAGPGRSQESRTPFGSSTQVAVTQVRGSLSTGWIVVHCLQGSISRTLDLKQG